MTVARIGTLRGRIPVTVGTFETPRKHEEPKVTTVTRMATLRHQKRRQLRGSRPAGPQPWHFWEGTHMADPFVRFGLNNFLELKAAPIPSRVRPTKYSEVGT